MPQIYNEEFRKKIVRLHLQEGRTYKSLYLVCSKELRNYAGNSATTQTTPRTRKGKCILKKSGGILNRCKVYPNAYYNYLKNRKAKYHLENENIS